MNVILFQIFASFLNNILPDQWNRTTGQIPVSCDVVRKIKPHLIVLKTQMHMSVIYQLNLCSAEYIRSSYILLLMKCLNKSLIANKTDFFFWNAE